MDYCERDATLSFCEMVLETAINGRANAVVTYNIADFAVAAKRFRISVLSPADLLKKVKA